MKKIFLFALALALDARLFGSAEKAVYAISIP